MAVSIKTKLVLNRSRKKYGRKTHTVELSAFFTLLSIISRLILAYRENFAFLSLVTKKIHQNCRKTNQKLNNFTKGALFPVVGIIFPVICWTAIKSTCLNRWQQGKSNVWKYLLWIRLSQVVKHFYLIGRTVSSCEAFSLKAYYSIASHFQGMLFK